MVTAFPFPFFETRGKDESDPNVQLLLLPEELSSDEDVLFSLLRSTLFFPFFARLSYLLLCSFSFAFFFAFFLFAFSASLRRYVPNLSTFGRGLPTGHGHGPRTDSGAPVLKQLSNHSDPLWSPDPLAHYLQFIEVEEVCIL